MSMWRLRRAVHKLMDMENLHCLFALARMEDRVYIVARSRLREVNVGEILLPFGGAAMPLPLRPP